MNDKDSKLIWEAWDTPVGNDERQLPEGEVEEDNEIRDQGIHDRPDAGQPLSEYGLKIEPGEERGDRDNPTIDKLWLIRPLGPEAREQFGPPQNGYDAYDWIYQAEVRGRSIEELEQIVIRSIHNHGKPRFFKPYAEPENKSNRAGLLPGEDPERSWQDNPGVYPPGYN